MKSYTLEIVVGALYLALAFLFPDKTLASVVEGLNLLLNMLPIFLCVIFFSSFLSVFLSPKTVKNLMGKESGFKGLLLATLLGTVIVGPLWVLFPLYKTLLDKGARYAVVGAMVGAFAIKTPWLPYGATFLGWPFIIISTSLILIYALAQGYLIESIMKGKESI